MEDRNNIERKFLEKTKNQKSKNLEPKRLINYGNFTPGKGFGNLNQNNEIRFGVDSRNDNNKFKVKKESMINDRFDYLFDSKKQSAEHLILPFNRGGEITRKNNLNGDKIFKYQEDDLLKDRPLPFNNLNDVKKTRTKKRYKKKFIINY